MYPASGLRSRLIPWCTLMGATIPVAMLAIQRAFPPESSRSFSYLYMANVAGAVTGTIIPLFLIELLGFHGTLKVGAACNCLIALSALMVSKSAADERSPGSGADRGLNHACRILRAKASLLALLFASGLTSMGMEVVWVRQFTPYVGTVVYAFALILTVYLLATFVGSRIYRRWSLRRRRKATLLWTLLALFALLPLLAASPKIVLYPALRLRFGRSRRSPACSGF